MSILNATSRNSRSGSSWAGLTCQAAVQQAAQRTFLTAAGSMWRSMSPRPAAQALHHAPLPDVLRECLDTGLGSR